MHMRAFNSQYETFFLYMRSVPLPYISSFWLDDTIAFSLNDTSMMILKLMFER